MTRLVLMLPILAPLQPMECPVPLTCALPACVTTTDRRKGGSKTHKAFETCWYSSPNTPLLGEGVGLGRCGPSSTALDWRVQGSNPTLSLPLGVTSGMGFPSLSPAGLIYKMGSSYSFRHCLGHNGWGISKWYMGVDLKVPEPRTQVSALCVTGKRGSLL